MKALGLAVQIFNSHLGLAVVTVSNLLSCSYSSQVLITRWVATWTRDLWMVRSGEEDGLSSQTELWSAMTLIWLVIRKCIVLHSISHFCSMMKLLEPYHLLAIPSHCLLRYTNHSKVVLSHRLLWFCRVIMWKDVVLLSWLILTIGRTSSSHPVHMTLKGN